MLPETEAMPALPISVFVRLRLSRMMGTSGAAAKVDIKHVKNEIHERWKVVIWGFDKEKILKTLALCSESTGIGNFAVASKVCSLPVTPWREAPAAGDPSSLAMD